jgi:two-component system CheB/CheR fusion protein
MDIHDLKHRVEVAEWARDYSRSIVDSVQVPLVVLAADLHVLSANAAYYERFRENAEETEGQGFFEIGAGEWEAAELREAVASVLATGGGFQGLDLERTFPWAGPRSMSVSGCLARSLTREPMILLAIEDVTERRRNERHRAELLAVAEEAKQRAERADAAKDLFLANLSHELRGPLAAILLHAELLQSGRQDARAVQETGAAIQKSTKRQARLIEELLDVSRIVAGKLDLEVRDVDLRGLVLGVLEGLRPTAEAKAVRLEVEIDGERHPCPGDPARLEQVVENLVSNAIKFTPRGGRVEVRVDAVDGHERLVVTDSGRGIAPAFLPHVFERFAQESDAATFHPGLGLGLAIVHHLVDLHGGTVHAESPGRDLGSTFTVTLPRRAPRARSGSPSAVEETRS